MFNWSVNFFNTFYLGMLKKLNIFITTIQLLCEDANLNLCLYYKKVLLKYFIFGNIYLNVSLSFTNLNKLS